MSENAPYLRLRGVAKTYQPHSAAPTPVLRGIDLGVRAGEALAVVGPSGCGKSTLLHLMAGLDAPTAGSVTCDGRDLAALGEREQARFRNEELGFVFQLHHLLPQCNVLENVLVPSLVHPRRAEAAARGRRLLERVGLGDRLHHRPARLSGGECQRVAAVRALINAPRLLLADEPTGSLDRAHAESLCGLLAELQREEGFALVMVTHAEHLARRMGRVLTLRDGRLAED